ncbi:hypothetical protein BJ165DRAFT_865961 [Panaeolus papilionaceus]|nr:hypothetical protein BJ165DRAFT_865961 [Panaeolus papilionaceus]
MKLHNLFPEVVLRICQDLNHNDRKCLRLTCHMLSQTLAIELWRKLSITMTESKLTEFLECLSGMAVMVPPVLAVKEICCVSQYDAEPNSVPGEVIKEPLSDALLNALLQLVNVRKISGPPDLAQRVTKVVSGLKELRELELCLHSCPPMSALTTFKNLRTINYSTMRGYNCTKLNVTSNAEEFGQSIAQSTNLQYLIVSLSPSFKWDLEKLFELCRLQGIQLRYLHSLTIGCCSSPLPLLPHLKRLKRLKMSRPPEPIPKEDEAYELFWRTLAKQDVRLRHLTVDYVPEGLVEYLKSYQGLKSFSLKKLPETTSRDAQTAKSFYNQVLPHHASSLRHLSMSHQEEDEWCWGPDAEIPILKCTKLKNLTIGITCSQLVASCPDTSDSESPEGTGSQGSSDVRLPIVN